MLRSMVCSVGVLLAAACVALAGDQPSKRVDDPFDDPAIRAANAAGVRVKKVDDNYQKTAARLSNAIDAYDHRKLEPTQDNEALSALHAYISEQLGLTHELVLALEEYMKSGGVLKSVVVKSEDVYREAARVHRDWYVEAAYDANKEIHKDFAEIYEGMAARAERRAKNLKVEDQQDLLRFLRENGQTLARTLKSIEAVQAGATVQSSENELIAKIARHRDRADVLNKHIKELKKKINTSDDTSDVAKKEAGK